MAGFFDKIIDMMNLNEYDEEEQNTEQFEEEEEDDDYYEERPVLRTVSSSRHQYNRSNNSNKVLNLQTSIQMEVHVVQPTSYDEACEICDYLIQRKPVVINLESIEPSIAQRIMDFVSGSCYTLEGNVQKVTSNIFIIAPANVDVAGNFKEELKSSGIILPWKGE